MFRSGQQYSTEVFTQVRIYKLKIHKITGKFLVFKKRFPVQFLGFFLKKKKFPLSSIFFIFEN